MLCVKSYLTSECAKSYFLTNSILKIINEHDKIYIYSPSLHQYLYQKLIKCFTSYIPINIFANKLNQEDIDLVIDEIVDRRDYEKSESEIGKIGINRRNKISSGKWQGWYNYPRSIKRKWKEGITYTSTV